MIFGNKKRAKNVCKVDLDCPKQFGRHAMGSDSVAVSQLSAALHAWTVPRMCVQAPVCLEGHQSLQLCSMIALGTTFCAHDQMTVETW